MNRIALIPARAGSKRIPNKNIRLLRGVPLLAYSIRAALDSKEFDQVVVSTDSKEYGDIAKMYGATDVIIRPEKMATDTSPDIEWLTHALKIFKTYEVFSILRPTSPFRIPMTIARAMNQFALTPCDSLRAVALCNDHPGKQWVLSNGYMTPLLLQPKPQPWHSSQRTMLPTVYTQTSGLEIGWSEMVLRTGTIAGEKIIPFVMEGAEAHDLNTEEDWVVAEYYLTNGAGLPEVLR